MQVVDAEFAAEADANWIMAEAEAGTHFIDADGSLCLVDGTAYSPSWRALSGGGTVYEASDGDDGLIEAYEETLDTILDDWSARHEESLGWEDGALFIFGRDYDHDAA